MHLELVGIDGASLKERLIRWMLNVDGISEVESLIKSKFTSDAPRLTEISDYLLGLGGKRIRPILTFLAAQAMGLAKPSDALRSVAAGIELIHMATLLHDDIIDNAPMRRRQVSPFKRYGMMGTLLAGDFLLTRAFALCAHLDEFVIDQTEAACIGLVEGEILETSMVEDTHDIKSSLLVADKKTASLFRLACITGAHIAGAKASDIQAMGEFGTKLGIAFQIVDDILDVTSDEKTLGKKVGTDIRERKPSIVNVLWRETESELSKMLNSAAKSTEADEAYVAAALSEIKSSKVLSKARELASSYAQSALDKLLEATKSYKSCGNSREVLETLIKYAVLRNE
jgi:geranylgeranyl pyrophosphate synthase